jgi:glycosyltransferase involved in cell wall biosynthesis
MHIIHLVQLYRPVPSGAAQYFVEIGERLAREGHRVTVLTTDAFDLEHLWCQGRHSIPEPEDTHNNVRVLRFPIQRLPGSSVLYPVLRRLMVEYARLPGPRSVQLSLLRQMATLTPRLPTLKRALKSPALADAVLVHSTNITLDFAILPVLQWAEQRTIPHICTPFTHLGEPGNEQIVRYYTMPHQLDILQRSAAVITQTSLEQHFLQRKGIEPERLHTIGVGVTPDDIRGGDDTRFRQEHNIRTPIVLTIGVAAYDKGTCHVVEAMQQLWAQGTHATWVQIGPTMAHFEHFIQSLPAEDRTRMRMLGFVSDEVRRDALAAANVFVLPSRTDSFGIVYLEAWVYGTPVVGAQAGGVPDVIAHGTDGLLVPFGHVTELASAIERLLRDHTLAQAMGEAGRRKVLHRYTWEQKYTQVRTLYNEVLHEYEKQERKQIYGYTSSSS